MLSIIFEIATQTWHHGQTGSPVEVDATDINDESLIRINGELFVVDDIDCFGGEIHMLTVPASGAISKILDMEVTEK